MTILNEALTASAGTTDTLDTIEKLTGIGFGNNAFKLLHHLRGTITGFSNFSRSLKRGTYNLDGNNHRVHQRLTYVWLSCRNGALPKGKSFEALAEEAFNLIRPV